MDQTNQHLGRAVIKALGGQQNIKSIGHCATRLRVQLNERKLVDLDTVKAIPGVLGAVDASGGVQVIIGNNVSKVYAEIQKEFNLSEGAATSGAAKWYDRLLNTLNAVLGPVIPLVMGSGLISAILVLAKMLGANPEGSTYQLLNTAANVAFYFLPVLLAYTSAIRFKCSPVYAIFFGGLLLHPALSELFNSGNPVTFLGLPVTPADYSATLIPIILTTWALSYVERFVEQRIPAAVKFTFKPLAIILVMTPITLLLTGPAGAIIGNGLATGLTAIYNTADWLALLFVSALAPLMVLTGTHLALLPLIITNFSTLGYDNLLFVAFIGMNFSQFAVAAAVMLKTKKPALRQLAFSSALTAFLSGVTEPTLYGITVRLKKPLIATFIGCLANGLFCALTKVKVFSFGAPSFFTMPIFVDPAGGPNFMYAVMAAALTIVVTGVATWVLGFDDSIFADPAAQRS